MKVIMLGTGSPRVNKNRFSSSQLLLVDDLKILVDCGEGATMQLAKLDIPPEEIKHLLFTHLHADHVLGYANFLISGWVEGRRELTVVGPKGTKKMHDQIIKMLENDIKYRLSLGRSKSGICDVKVIEILESGLVDVDIPVKIHCASMIHNVSTFAYRFEKEGKSIVFSGDTAPSDELVQLSKNANLLIHDACLTLIQGDQLPNASTIWENLQKEHCTPTQAAETAKKANVDKLVLTHFLPKIDPQEVYLAAAKVFDGEIFVPNDLDVINATSRVIETNINIT